MKALALFTVLFSGLSVMAGPLHITAAPPTVGLLPTTLATCAQVAAGDTSAPALAKESFQVGNFSLQWPDDASLTMTSIQITMQSPDLVDGEYDVTIDGAELLAVMGGKTTFQSGENVQSVCSLRGGGVTFVNPKAASNSVAGTVTITGYETDANGGQAPVQAQMLFNGVFKGEP